MDRGRWPRWISLPSGRIRQSDVFSKSRERLAGGRGAVLRDESSDESKCCRSIGDLAQRCGFNKKRTSKIVGVDVPAPEVR